MITLTENNTKVAGLTSLEFRALRCNNESKFENFIEDIIHYEMQEAHRINPCAATNILVQLLLFELVSHDFIDDYSVSFLELDNGGIFTHVTVVIHPLKSTLHINLNNYHTNPPEYTSDLFIRYLRSQKPIEHSTSSKPNFPIRYNAPWRVNK